MSVRHQVTGVAAVIVAALLPAAAWADTLYPNLEIGGVVEIQNDHVVEADDPAPGVEGDGNDLFATIEPSIALQFSERFSLNTDLVIEPVRDRTADDDRFFEDHGLYAETLFLELTGQGWSLVAGKFNPAFGVAWDAAPGIYGTDFAEDYELTEKIGFGGALDVFGEGDGAHRVDAAVFFADTSPLSRSAFTDRGRTRKSSGGRQQYGKSHLICDNS